jgi:hypothetical protein
VRKIDPIIIDGVEHKRCSKCRNIKPYSDFPKSITKWNGIDAACKICKNIFMKKLRKTHPNWKEATKKWATAHPEKTREKARRWRLKNPIRKLELQRVWKQNNIKRLKSYHKKYRSTIRGKLNHRMSMSIWQALRKNKDDYHWEILVGYTVNVLKQHLESKFTDGMTWDNMGKWHIDHIIPKSRFHYEKPEDPEFKVCWGLSNLQPMWKLDNLSKHAKTMEEWKQYKEKNERTKAG